LVSEQLVDFVQRLPRLPDQPLIVVMDNGSIHVSRVVRAAQPLLRRERIYLYYLPPYSPEFDLIEPVFGGIKAHELPARAYTSWEALEEAIIDGFTQAEQRLLAKGDTHLRKPA
jgi:transposase